MWRTSWREGRTKWVVARGRLCAARARSSSSPRGRRQTRKRRKHDTCVRSARCLSSMGNGTPLALTICMRKILPALAISAMLVGLASATQAQVSVGIRIGPPPAPHAYRVPPRRSPNSAWVEGYWAPQGSQYRWHDGHWAQPPRRGAYWQEPYYANGHYFAGSWQGGNAHQAQNGHSDRSQNDHR